jgi:hypothetical protein
MLSEPLDSICECGHPVQRPGRNAVLLPEPRLRAHGHVQRKTSTAGPLLLRSWAVEGISRCMAE